MTKQLHSTKIFIYISIFGCLLNLVANEEGNFYLAGFEGKSWKLDLEDTPNGKTLADKLKSEKTMPLKFNFVIENNGKYFYCVSDIVNFKIEPATAPLTFQPYDILAITYGSSKAYLKIVLENDAEVEINAAKIGQLKNGTNSLSELHSAVLEKWDNDDFSETLILFYSEEPIEEVEDKSKIGWIIAILTLLAGGLCLLLSRCL